MKKLTLKQTKFVHEYIISGNATDAAIKAGYSKGTARVIGCENLTKPYINVHIAQNRGEITKNYGITEELILEGIASIACDKGVRDSDRLKGYELLGKWKNLKMFTEKVEHSVSDDMAALILEARKRNN